MQTQTPSPTRWWLRLVTFTLAALAAASATLWTLKWSATNPSQPAVALLVSEPSAAEPQAVARLLGGGKAGLAAAPGVPIDNPASHFKLIGVVAARDQGGYALIAVDSQPAKPYRVGARVNDAWVLHSVMPRSAMLAARADGPVGVTLDLPKLALPQSQAPKMLD